MKNIIMIAIAVMLCGCQKNGSTPQEIWRGGTIAPSEVQTPPGFTLTPVMAVSNGCQLLGPSKRVPVLWADSSNYYFTYGPGETALRQAITIKGKE